MQQRKGIFLLTAGVTLPAVLWFAYEGLVINVDSLGRIAGLVGLAALSINIILSARLAVFDNLFHGLDKMYRIHHILGCITLLFVLAHFNLIVIKFSQISLTVGYDFILGFGGWYRFAGKLGLLLLTSGMIVVLYFKVTYKWFITTQRIMGAVVFLGGYHALFVPGSTLLQQPVLLAYMLIIGGFAAVVYIYRSIFHKTLNKIFNYRVTRVSLLGQVTEIYMKPTGKSIQHYAGQYAFLSFNSKRISDEVHPFSISSGSSSPELRFSVKQIGDFTSTLPKLKTGDTVNLEGPFGQFTPTKIGGKHQVWIAGGIGVTPFLSMIQSINKQLSVDLYYCTVNKKEAVYLEELLDSAQTKNVRVYSVCEDKDGFLTAKRVKGLRQDSQILICGPPPMMKNLQKQFIENGIKKDSIHFEEFTLS